LIPRTGERKAGGQGIRNDTARCFSGLGKKKQATPSREQNIRSQIKNFGVSLGIK
jgi:hypothetical protein